MKEFCPENCGLEGSCPNDCHHHNDEALEPFTTTVFGKLVLITGMNGDHYYTDDGTQIHKSQV